MSLRRVDAFFYGLFMDAAVLEENRVVAAEPRRGSVDGLELRIGRRATLVPAAGARAYGMVFALTHDDLERLYSPPGLTDYRPEAVVVRLLDGGTLPALCYNLPEAPDPAEANGEYAARLRATLAGLGFPPEYIASIPITMTD